MTPADVVAIATEDRVEQVPVIETPAWPVAFQQDEVVEE